MPFKRRSQKLNNSIKIKDGLRWDDFSSWLCSSALNPLYNSVTRLGGGVKYAWRKASRGKYNGLVATPTSMEGGCKRGKCIELGSILTGLEGGCKTC